MECKKNIFRIVNEIEQYCNQESIDIIILHHEGVLSDLIFIMLKNRLQRVKFVRYIHTCYNKYYKNSERNLLIRKISKIMVQQALNKSDFIIFISHAVKHSFEKNFKLKKHNRVIYNGIPKNFFENVKEKSNKNNNITYVGRLSKVKGVDTLIEAFNLIYRQYENIKLIITGDGEEKENLQNMIIKLKLNNNIEFTGRKDDVIPILDETDIFIYPTVWEEGFGISVIEAMARGCIPITFNTGGLKEIITNNINGILVKDINVDSLAKAIERVINLPKEEKEKMREEAKKRAKDFKIDKTINDIEMTLKSLR